MNSGFKDTIFIDLILMGKGKNKRGVWSLEFGASGLNEN
jgi:hypothetical protein